MSATTGVDTALFSAGISATAASSGIETRMISQPACSSNFAWATFPEMSLL
jgi:hypothetical protein